jgi:hypothetical protein
MLKIQKLNSLPSNFSKGSLQISFVLTEKQVILWTVYQYGGYFKLKVAHLNNKRTYQATLIQIIEFMISG